MSGKPEKIFLRKLTHFDMLCSVWGKKRVRDTDIEYIRADLAKPSEEVKRLEQDKERLDWLDSTVSPKSGSSPHNWLRYFWPNDDTLREAIDKARKPLPSPPDKE